MLNPKELAIEYFEKEYKLLEDYRKKYKQYNSLVKMREDKIHGAEHLAMSTGLMSLNELTELKNKIINNG